MGFFSSLFNGSDDEWDDEEIDDDDNFEDYYRENGKSSDAVMSIKDDMPEARHEETSTKKTGLFGRKKETIKFSKSSNRFGVCIFKPTMIEDGQEIAEVLLSGQAVIANFEGLNSELSQRIIDFASGCCYALDGNLQKISNYVFIMTPSSMCISGDVADNITPNSYGQGFCG